MSEHKTITFHNAPDFADFLKAYGLKDAKNDLPVVFKTRDGGSEYRRHSENLYIHFDRYTAMAKMGDLYVQANFKTKPEALRGWTHGEKQTLYKEFDAKLYLLNELKELGVDTERLTKLGKVTKRQLREFIDSSPVDDLTTEEVTMRRKNDPDDTLIFEVKDQPFKQVTLTIKKKEGYKDTLEYTLSADWSAKWQERIAAIEKVVAESKFKLFSAEL